MMLKGRLCRPFCYAWVEYAGDFGSRIENSNPSDNDFL